jgi:para-aminobenzoate synthetase / 4-amino-4-deoxychorismate lyase
LKPVAIFESHDPRRKGRSFRFLDFQSEVRADEPREVLPALAEVDEAVAHGRHAAGFIAYEAAEGIDPAFRVCQCADEGSSRRTTMLPLLWFGIYGAKEEFDARVAGSFPDLPEIHWQPSISPEAYAAGIQRIRNYIAAGHTYQVNFTYRLHARFKCDPWSYYRKMCAAQRAAFCAFIDLGSHQILSASPELFFEWQGESLITRPMKGTASRGRFWAEDEECAASLLRSEKNRAENLMIVDMMRNDMGRIAETGSVAVPHLFEIERYETILQMTSTITAKLGRDIALSGIFRALFPSGSITGAPKIRTVEIIREIEKGPRGIYTGAIGFVSPGSCAIFNVAIRTVAVDQAKGLAEFGVGGGITYDSSAQSEYQECLDKARFLGARLKDFKLLETILFEPNEGYFLLGRHLDRMENSARYYGFRFDRESVMSALNRRASSFGPGSHRVRLVMGREGFTKIDSTMLPSSAAQTPAPALIDFSLPVDSENPFFFNKTTNREHYERVAHAYPPDWHVIMTNREGKVTESIFANVVAKIDGCLYTPPIKDGLLPGTYRAELLERGEITERSLAPEDLLKADSVFLINSVRRWIPVVMEAESNPETVAGSETNGED